MCLGARDRGWAKRWVRVGGGEVRFDVYGLHGGHCADRERRRGSLVYSVDLNVGKLKIEVASQRSDSLSRFVPSWWMKTHGHIAVDCSRGTQYGFCKKEDF